MADSDSDIRSENLVLLVHTMQATQDGDNHNPHLGMSDALALQKIARRLHHLDENACNYGLQEREEKEETRLESRAVAIAQGYGLKVYRQGDPRGWPLYLYDPDKISEDKIESVYWPQAQGVCPR